MTTSTKYIGMDVHKESISIAVRNAAGKIVMECVIETKASMIHGDHGLRTLKGAAQLSDHHRRSQSSDDPGEGHLSHLGHSLYRQAGLCIAPSCHVARKNQRTRGTLAGGVLLPTAGCAEVVASGSAERSTRGEQEAQGLERALRDSVDRRRAPSVSVAPPVLLSCPRTLGRDPTASRVHGRCA
jgi:hypothetical protein